MFTERIRVLGFGGRKKKEIERALPLSPSVVVEPNPGWSTFELRFVIFRWEWVFAVRQKCPRCNIHICSFTVSRHPFSRRFPPLIFSSLFLFDSDVYKIFSYDNNCLWDNSTHRLTSYHHNLPNLDFEIEAK